MRIECVPALAYLAPTKGRRYLTKRSAVRAEARALMDRKYPAEKGDASDGYSNWHWSDDGHLQQLYERLVRLIACAARQQVTS